MFNEADWRIGGAVGEDSDRLNACQGGTCKMPNSVLDRRAKVNYLGKLDSAGFHDSRVQGACELANLRQHQPASAG